MSEVFKNAIGVLSYDGVHTKENTVIVFPDKGAYNRSYTQYENLYGGIVYFDKVRDPLSGNITSLYTSQDDLLSSDGSTNIFVIDDICDGGRTFINIGNYIRKLNPDCKLTLLVTHGIFSHNAKNNLNMFNNVIAINDWS